MALPDTLLIRLIETVQDFELSGDFAMLGGQRWLGSRRGKSAKRFRQTIEKRLPGLTEAELHNPDNEYSERFFEKLGFSKVDSIDVSDFEGASIILDLSKPVTRTKAPKFDVIYDGGTTEHVFDIATAWRNIDAMLKPGGVLIGHSPCNNWINHGFFQIGPEAVYGFWENALGYEVLDLKLQPLRPDAIDRVATTTNPNETGSRPRIRGKLPAGIPTIIAYAVRKPSKSSARGKDVYQTDYQRRWES